MKRDFFNVRKHPMFWGIPLAGVVAWHGVHVALYENPQYLFWICYTANVLLCLGVFTRSGLLVGAGFGWQLIAFPLWLYEAVRTSGLDGGCTLFHVAGLAVGAAAIGSFRFPKHTWAFALGVAVCLQLCARFFTDEALNINGAFRVYDGWEAVYPSHAVFQLSTLVVLGLAFAALTYLNNRRFAGKDGGGDG